jgi:predicted AlkP superfamily pyrophosphatase or phosphodiesterase
MPDAAGLAKNRRTIRLLLVGVVAVACLFRLGVEVRNYFTKSSRDDLDPGPSTVTFGSVKDIDRVVIISVDGLRPDLLLRANTPRIRSLMKRGSYTMWARTTEMSITLPSHTSMLTGVRPDVHKIFWNDHAGKETAFADVPTIFEQARKASRPLSTGLVAGKSKFHQLAKPGSMDFIDVYPDGKGSNLEVGEAAADMIRRHGPRVLFVHFPDVDATGHKLGWGTPQQITAIERADDGVGMILDALNREDYTDRTLIILSADHGGQGLTHGPNDPRSRNIPWICAGPGVRQNYDLARLVPLVVNTEDTFVTACTMMRIPLPAFTDGKPIEQAFANDELLKAYTAKKEEDVTKTSWWDPPSYTYEPTPIPSQHN